MYVGTSNAADEKEELSGYLAGADSSVSSISFDDTPPDYTEYLRLLYSGNGRLIPDESKRPPPRDSDSKWIATKSHKATCKYHYHIIEIFQTQTKFSFLSFRLIIRISHLNPINLFDLCFLR